MRNLLICLAFLGFYINVFSQSTNFPKDFFGYPLDIPLTLAGNFGELRPNHFHAGLDLRTNGKEGLKVYSVADGYVSRIKVSGIGYGKIIYITHPNGYVSTYAHLSKFSERIENYVRAVQYKNETFEIELFPEADILPVKKGELIALSGNTGGSQAPHLHFEIREEKSEHAVNPLFFGFGIQDNQNPEISLLALYPLAENSFVENKHFKKVIPVVPSAGNSRISKDTIAVSGKIGFGLETYDRERPGGNRNGTYSISVYKDDAFIYFAELDKMPFDQSRAINSHCDLMEKRTKGHWLQKTFPAPNNRLPIYKILSENGTVTVNPGEKHKIRIVAKDIFGNQNVLQFWLKGVQPPAPVPQQSKISAKAVANFDCHKVNTLEKDGLKLELPLGSLYENLQLEYFLSAPFKGLLSNVYHIHSDNVPLHLPLLISIKVDTLLPNIKQKGIIVSVNPSTGRMVSEGGEFKNGYISSKSKNFGNFAVTVDLTPPSITPVNITNGKSIRNQRTISFRIGDNLSGVKTYKGYIDGKWVLMEFDNKNALLTYYKEPTLPIGKHSFELIVTDVKGNQSKYSASFIN